MDAEPGNEEHALVRLFRCVTELEVLRNNITRRVEKNDFYFGVSSHSAIDIPC
jgi:hypothetical protein